MENYMSNPDIPATIIVLWRTMRVTALAPGWRNVFTEEDGSPTYTMSPALLLQERYAKLYPSLDNSRPPLEIAYDEPRATRVVFAQVTRTGELTSVLESNNYVQTLAPLAPEITSVGPGRAQYQF